MKIQFNRRKLEKKCNDPDASNLGANTAKKLKQRMEEFRAAESLAEIKMLPGARLHPLTGDLSGRFAVNLDHPRRLLLLVANDPIPQLSSGGVDLMQVTEITIVEIKDYH